MRKLIQESRTTEENEPFILRGKKNVGISYKPPFIKHPKKENKKSKP